MRENENIYQKNSEENFQDFIGNEQYNEYESEEEPKTPPMSFSLNDDNYNKNTIDSQHDEKNNKEDTTPNMVETKATSEILKEKNNIEIVPHIIYICATVDLHCKLNLRKIVENTLNCEYNPKKINFLIMRLKNQKGFANLSESGKMLCSGFNSEQALKKAVIKYNNKIKSCGYSTKLNFEEISINNILATCDIKFNLPLSKLLTYLVNLNENGLRFIIILGFFQDLLIVKGSKIQIWL